jgi:hypothetical protein
MNFLSRIVRYLFWVIVAVWGMRLLRWIFGVALRNASPVAGSSRAPEMPHQNRRLVRDPVCGTHVAELLSIPLREGSETVHFCSEQCREKYMAGLRRYAANG